MKSKKDESSFRGVLTPELREFIRHKRRLLGVTLQQLGDMLKINWSTIRKWEDGTVGKCRNSHVGRLSKFLSGEYDEELKRQSTPVDPLHSRHYGRNSPMLFWMERAAILFGFCEKYPEIQQEFIDGVGQVLNSQAYTLQQEMQNEELAKELKIEPEQEIGK